MVIEDLYLKICISYIPKNVNGRLSSDEVFKDPESDLSPIHPSSLIISSAKGQAYICPKRPYVGKKQIHKADISQFHILPIRKLENYM